MRRTIFVIVLACAGPAQAQSVAPGDVTGARPGNDIGTGMSLPRSDVAGNLNQATTRSELAPNLPAPGADDVRGLLAEAARDLAASRTGAAQEALERAETRVLDRSVPAGTERIQAADPLVSAVTQARAALAAGDLRGARAVIAGALRP